MSKQSSKPEALVITAFHKDVYAIINMQRVAVDKAQGTMQSKLSALIDSKYGTTAPTYAQFRADRDALKELAKEKGLVDDQWLRKPFNAAIIATFGKLPEALTAAAIAKRAVRAAEEAKKAAALDKVNAERAVAGMAPLAVLRKGVAGADAGKAGAPKGETTQRVASEAETVEQMIARVGLWKVMDACARILNADTSTQDVAKVIQPEIKKHLKAA